MRKRIWCGLLVAAGCVAMGQGAGPAKVPFTVSRETTVLTGPLLPDGRVDYIAALNDRYGMGVTAENNALVAWLGIVGTDSSFLGKKERGGILRLAGAEEVPSGSPEFMSFDQTDYYKKLASDEKKNLSRRMGDLEVRAWKEEDFPEFAAYLKEEGPLLDRTREAFKRQRWWVPSVSGEGDSLIFMVQHSNGPTKAAMALCARATLRAGKGDFDGFFEDVMAAGRVGLLLGQSPSFSEKLNGFFAATQAERAIGWYAGTGDLTEDQCLKLSKALVSLEGTFDEAEAIDGAERWGALDLTAALALRKWGSWGDEVGVDSTMKVAAIRFLSSIDVNDVDWDLVLRVVNQKIDGVVSAVRGGSASYADLTWRKLAPEMKEASSELEDPNFLKRWSGETRVAYSERIARFVLLIAYPAYIPDIKQMPHYGMITKMTEALVAAAAIEAKTGKWPGSLEELVAVGAIDHLPEDLDSGGQVKYRVTDVGAYVYGVGENGEDEHGSADDVVVGSRRR